MYVCIGPFQFGVEMIFLFSNSTVLRCCKIVLKISVWPVVLSVGLI